MNYTPAREVCTECSHYVARGYILCSCCLHGRCQDSQPRLNPVAYRACVNTLYSMVDWLCHFRLDMTPEMGKKADECISALKQALAHAQEPT